ncbi:DUF971 domain-containing protein [Verrucomicrobia bacterium]|jgi:DUF971 family protein|nr:DUF971 domain-containing protein [Pedosphaera sp.]MBL6844788.1 DUF971 domain-containing protein [Verrucomicrobiae bacterium]MBT3597095.1 DUF971 domain-containing protein [Verrucomicrobiota bacterium]RZO69020.1 MAG: DUF971 domain-containing protein [Limisphaerales bacterium]HAR00010.1 DUF971 domain-containing protein [Verrucomicrobiales bacterium]|tara:strand:- start:1987 stop:2298 length:312 start_codon:yes stop_codon:yes gene_type:complete
MQLKPEQLDLIGNEVAIKWNDGSENFFNMEQLRAASPSAENKGEPDLFGNIHGASSQTEFPGVKVIGWTPIGGYAIRFDFSDGHRTGLYSFDYLKRLAKNGGN